MVILAHIDSNPHITVSVASSTSHHGKLFWSPPSDAPVLTSDAQPAFAAINLEPEENIEDEVDNTKELQVWSDAPSLLQSVGG